MNVKLSHPNPGPLNGPSGLHSILESHYERARTMGAQLSLRLRQSEKHGFRPRGKESPEYSVWRNMKRRCTDKTRHNYKYYGGRGIKVCEEWMESFSCFMLDMGPRPAGATLERRDVNGDYCPDNCYWETSYAVQLKNRRPYVTRKAGHKRERPR